MTSSRCEEEKVSPSEPFIIIDALFGGRAAPAISLVAP
jgi:hypothetical protein